MPFPQESNNGGNFNLFNFRQTIGDPARPYLFLVHIPEIGKDEVVTSLARSTSLPKYTIKDIAIPFQGVQINIGGTVEPNQDWTVDFICDEAHELRRLFFKWQSLIYDIGTGLTGHSSSYKSDAISVAQMARNGTIVANYGLVGAYPKEVDQIEVSHDKGAEFESFKVTFKFDYFTLMDKNGEQTKADSFVRSTKSIKINRGAPPPGGQWKTPFTPQ